MGGGGELGFPKQLAPPQRRALHDRLTVLNHGQAQQILDELSGRMAVAQVKNPLRYCATLIERAVQEARAPLFRRPRLILTGGAAETVAPLLRIAWGREDDLVLRGLAVLAGSAHGL